METLRVPADASIIDTILTILNWAVGILAIVGGWMVRKILLIDAELRSYKERVAVVEREATLRETHRVEMVTLQREQNQAVIEVIDTRLASIETSLREKD